MMRQVVPVFTRFVQMPFAHDARLTRSKANPIQGTNLKPPVKAPEMRICIMVTKTAVGFACDQWVQAPLRVKAKLSA